MLKQIRSKRLLVTLLMELVTLQVLALQMPLVISASVSGSNSGYGSDTTNFTSHSELLGYLKPGDLVECRRLTYSHWAMYSDIPGYVFHVRRDRNRLELEAKVGLDKLVDVANGNLCRKNNKRSGAISRGLKARLGGEAVRAAKLILNQTIPFSLAYRNCEYYCTQWRFGTGFSEQSDDRPLGADTLNVVEGLVKIASGIVTQGFSVATEVANMASNHVDGVLSGFLNPFSIKELMF